MAPRHVRAGRLQFASHCPTHTDVRQLFLASTYSRSGLISGFICAM